MVRLGVGCGRPHAQRAWMLSTHSFLAPGPPSPSPSFQPPLARTLIELFDNAWRELMASKEFLVYLGERYTFGAVATAADEVSVYLQSVLGVRPGDR